MKNGKKNGHRKPVGTWISESKYLRLQRIARKEKRSVSRILEEAVDRILKTGSSGIESVS
jgi:hypothetical protein